MICDFAEYYHITDFTALPLKTQAALLYGLPSDSRTKKAITGQRYGNDTLLLAAILDQLRLITWTKSKKGTKKPESIYKAMTEPEKKNGPEIMAFDSPEDFERAWQSL